jgi:DegV family protein with EDD domain
VPDIAIVTDSVACLPDELVERYRIDVIPFNILSGGRVYREKLDITTAQAYELFLKNPDTFKTSPASPEECLEAMQKAAQKAKSILCITVSARISTLYNVVGIAQKQFTAAWPDIRIEMLDSETATAAEGFIVLAAARAIEKGNSIEEAVTKATSIKNKVHAVVLLDTVRHVYRSGRVPKLAAQAAEVLNIKPIFTVSGVVNFATAVRSKKSGVERIIGMMRDKVGSSPVHVAVMHAYAPEDAAALKERVAGEFDYVELWTTEFSPIMGYACGTGTLGLAFYAGEPDRIV